MSKIQRYDVFGASDYDDAIVWCETEKQAQGEFVFVRHLIKFAEQFSKDHVVRTALLEALGEVDEKDSKI